MIIVATHHIQTQSYLHILVLFWRVETHQECKHKLPAVKVIKSRSTMAIGSKERSAGSQKLKETKLIERAEKKAPLAMLYAFPSFDRSDSLIFFPTSLCRLMNSGDIPQLSKLVKSHFAKSCAINISFWDGPKIDVNFMLRMYAMMLEIHPDSIQVAQNTKVDGNRITSSIFAKHTDSRAIHHAVSRTTKDPYLSTKLLRERGEELQKVLQREPRSPEELQRYHEMAASDDDLTLYLHLEVDYLIDDLTKKVSHFSINGKITSMEVAKKDPAHLVKEEI